MKSTKLIFPMSGEQMRKLKRFLLKHKIKCDGKTEFGLIAEPKIDNREFIIKLLTSLQYKKVDKFFQKEGIYNDR